MSDNPIATHNMHGMDLHVFSDYISAAITTGTNKREWILPFAGRIVDVICDSEVAGSGGGNSDVIDVNINGTTIYTTQANRNALLNGNTGMFNEAGEPENANFRAGDILSYDIDTVGSTGSSRFKISIVVIRR